MRTYLSLPVRLVLSVPQWTPTRCCLTPRLQWTCTLIRSERSGRVYLTLSRQVGYLEQEPKLDDGETVESNIEAAVVPTRKLLKEYEQV